MADDEKLSEAKARLGSRRTSVDVIPKRNLRSSDILRSFFSNAEPISLEEANPVDQAELEFLRQFQDELSKSDIPFLESVPANTYIAERANAMKNKVTVPLKGKNPIQTLTGPKLDRGTEYEEMQQFGNQVCAQTVSTYPQRAPGVREGDPICDRYGFRLYGNRSICVVADGCNWGESPKKAAVKARDAVIKYIGEHHHKIYSVGDAQLYLLRSFNEAHRDICIEESKGPGPGSTTLLAGLTLEIQGAPRFPNEWAFVCASVGDCKAFLIEHDTLQVWDITEDNRGGQLHDSDCGGRLGPVMDNGGPDLRNLRTYCIRCQPGDFVVCVSDGVHDNFHPQMLGISPRDLKLDFDTWEEAEKVINVETEAAKYRIQYLQRLIAELDCSPESIVKTIMSHCVNVTKSSRTWMENNRGKKLPNDFKKFPGKMDHTTCVAFRVGIAHGNFSRSSSQMSDAPHESMFIPIAATLVKSEKEISIQCRTIAKGKFECLAKKTECILSVAPREQFQLKEEEILLETDELSNTISRVITFPPGVRIDIHSKKIAYDPVTGIITIRFSRVG